MMIYKTNFGDTCASDINTHRQVASIMIYKTNFVDTCASDIEYTQTGCFYNDI